MMAKALKGRKPDVSAPTKPKFMIFGPPNVGKCLGRGTPVLMFDGTIKPVEEVEQGDTVMGPDSCPREVLSTTAGREQLYRVLPVKGDPYVVNESHILSLKNTDTKKITNLSVRDYIKRGVDFRNRNKGWRAGVTFYHQDVTVNPYWLGLWLADGSAYAPVVWKPDAEVRECCEDMAREWKLECHHRTSGDKCPGYAITKVGGRETTGSNPLTVAMQKMGLVPDKFVPQVYKSNDRHVRYAILAGILDGDGHCHSHGGFDFISKSRRLAEDVCFLARSLGLAAYLRPCRKTCGNNGVEGDYFRVGISGDCSRIPTRIARKKASKRTRNRDVLTTGISVEPIGEGDYFGFELSGDGLFLLGDFTVTHNTTVSMDFPQVYYIDTEGGAAQPQYQRKLIASGGLYLGKADGSNHFPTVIEELNTLATTQHDRLTVVIDSFSKLYNIASAQAELRVGSDFGKDRKEANKPTRQLMLAIERLDMNVVLICHAKDKWVKAGKELVNEGKTFDGFDKMEYDLDLCLFVDKDYHATVHKTRIEGFKRDDRFPWSFAEFERRAGQAVMLRPPKPFVPATPEQVTEIQRLLDTVKVSEDWAAKCLAKANVESWDELDGDTIAKCIKYLVDLAAGKATK